MNNIPQVKLGIVAVSRDCFPIGLSQSRRAAVVAACAKKGLEVYEAQTTVENEKDMLAAVEEVTKAGCNALTVFLGNFGPETPEKKGLEVYEAQTTVENEKDMLAAVEEVTKAGCNALTVFLGNFGPETPETLIAKHFDGPCMFVAAAEGDGDLINGRGDAYCGMLNCSYNLGLRGIKGYIPEYPVGTAEEIAEKMVEFVPIARAVLGLKGLKIITFGPRPQDFFACNAPIQGLYDLGVEIEENSELDLLVSYKEHEGDPRIPDVCADMAAEMGEGKYYPDMLNRMAQFELTLLDWAEAHKGSRQYVAGIKGYIPEYPVGTAEEIAEKMVEFVPIARAVLGLKGLKIITFGPRPQDFFACNAPIQGLYDLGVEIEENSELDLLVSYKEHEGDPRIPDVCADMAAEMGEGKYYPDMLNRMAQFELTLLDWAEAHKGSRQYVAFADKCWPAFPSQFGFEPCYVNSRLASRGIPVFRRQMLARLPQPVRL